MFLVTVHHNDIARLITVTLIFNSQRVVNAGTQCDRKVVRVYASHPHPVCSVAQLVSDI